MVCWNRGWREIGSELGFVVKKARIRLVFMGEYLVLVCWHIGSVPGGQQIKRGSWCVVCMIGGLERRVIV